MPLVSVVVPHFNRGAAMAPTLRSLVAQTFIDWELIVVDDASAQAPTDIVRDLVPDATVILQPVNLGPSAARNAGIAAARGRFIAFLDSDDYWEPKKLDAQVSAILAHDQPDHAICVTKTKVIYSSDNIAILPKRSPNPGEPFSEFLYIAGGFAQSSSMFLSTSLAKRVGFEPTLRQYEDHLFFIRLGNLGASLLLVDQPLVHWKNDPRADRLSNNDDIDKAYAYLSVGSGDLTERASLAFLAKYLGPQIFARSPIEAVRLFLKARSRNAISNRDFLLFFLKLSMPKNAYLALRHRVGA